MIDVLSCGMWYGPIPLMSVEYSNNKTKQPIYAMDLHTGCSNKNVPVTYCYSGLLVHSYGDSMVIACIKGFIICHKTS